MHFAHTPQFSIRKVDVGKKSTTVVFTIKEDDLITVESVLGHAFLIIRELQVGNSLIDVRLNLNVVKEG